MNLNKLFPNDMTYTVSCSLAKIIGLNEALVLQRLDYWLTKPNVGIERDGYKWVYNTYKQWQKNFPFLCIRTIKSIFHDLEEKGLIISAQYNKASWDRTKFYRINYQALDALISGLTDTEDDDEPFDDTLEMINNDKSKVQLSQEINDCTMVGASLAPGDSASLVLNKGADLAPSEGTDFAPSEGTDFAPSEGTDFAPLLTETTTEITTKTTAKNTNSASLAKASDAPSASDPPKPVVTRSVLDIFWQPDDLLPDNPPPDDFPPDDMFIFPPPDDPPPDDPPPDKQPPDNHDKPAAPKLSDTAREFLRLFGAKRFKTQAQFEQFAEFERQYPPNTILDAARWASTTGMAMGGALIAMKTALKKWDQPKKTTKPVERAYSPQINEPKGYAALRQWAKEEGINDLGI